MSSDKNFSENFVEIIPLGNAPLELGVISPKMIEIIEQTQKSNKKTLIFYNRRGSASAWICRDCGFFEKCPNCDIAFSYHSFPRRRLLCHQCNMSSEITISCPNCHWNNFTTVGVGIEQIANKIQKITGLQVGILDSDHIKKSSEIPSLVENSDIILSTNLGALLSDESIGSVIFALFEINFSIPEYSLDEELFAQVSYFKKQKKPLYIQTFMNDNPLLQNLVFGNFRSYFDSLKAERKKFSYPPFVDFVIIRIHHKEKNFVKNLQNGLLEHIQKCDISETFLAFDTDIWEKSHGEWMQKIILKGKNVSDILEQISPFIIKNRHIFVDWQ